MAWKKFEERFVAWLLTLTELLEITAPTFMPPKNPLTIVATPNALMSLLMLDLLFLGSNLSTAFMLNNDSMLETRVTDNTIPQKTGSFHFEKSGVGTDVSISLGNEISSFLLMGFSPVTTEKYASNPSASRITHIGAGISLKNRLVILL